MRVMKRDGTIVKFDIHKIQVAIEKAFLSCQKEYDEDILGLLSLRVSADIQEKIKDKQVQVEDIQDSVEKILSIAGYTDVSKAYILYRKKRENVRDIESSAMHYQKIVDGYLNGQQSEQEYSLPPFSIGGLILSNSASITKNYWMNTVYDDEIRQAHGNGDIYIHDLDMLSADSAGWSLYTLLKDGLSAGKKISSRPPKHLFTACNQLVNFLGIMQNEWAGAQCIPSFDTYLAPFIKKDQLSQEDVQKCMESFIYGVNMPSRWGSQSPFSTIGLDWNVPSDLKDQPAMIGGKNQDFTYGDCQEEMKMIQKAFLQTLLDGDSSGRSFPFPIPCIKMDETFDWDDSQRNELLFKVTSQYGSPYFSNEISTQNRNPRVSLTKLDTHYGKACGYFGYGENTGSIGMVTLNLPRLAYLSKDEDDFFIRLEKKMDVMVRALNTKRQVLSRFLESGLYPYTAHYLSSFDSCFSTLGIIGMNEACLYASWIQQELNQPDALKFCIKVLQTMKTKILDYQQKYHCFFNLEAAPAENVSYQLVQLDKENYPEMNPEQKMYYTNSTTLPAHFTEDVFEALSIQEKLQSIYTGGSVFHVFLDEGIEGWKDCLHLVKVMMEKYTIPNITISPSYSICASHGYIKGVEDHCPTCQEESEIYSRVAGYYQPIDQGKVDKFQEFKERKNYIVK